MKFSWRILIFKVFGSGKAGGAESESLGRLKSLNGSIATWLGFSYSNKVQLGGKLSEENLTVVAMSSKRRSLAVERSMFD